MKVNWPSVSDSLDVSGITRLLRDLIRTLDASFAKVRPDDQISIGGGEFITKHLSKTFTLNFAAPGAVPGQVEQDVSVTGAVLGNQVLVSAPLAWPSGLSLHGFVKSADTITVRWTQISGAAANPDGGGGTYRVDVWQH